MDDSTQFDPPTEDHFNGDGQLEKRVRNAGSTDPAEVKNYYIRSSILNKVISEANGTGRKLKTFVPANGTTLATQTLYYTGQTPTESLTFIHTDASGTGAQQTMASGNTTYSRTGEYSPMGRNIADAGPYISLDTYEEPGQNGIDLFGSGEGYRPGQNTYTIDGMKVSAAHFMLEINSGRIGGMFGLMQIAFRMSNRKIGVGVHTSEGWVIGGPAEEGEFREIAKAKGYTLHRFFLQSDNSWSALLTIVGQNNPRYNSLHDAPNSAYSDSDKEALKNKVNKALTENCKKKLNELLTKLRSDIMDISELANKVFRGDGIALSITDAPIDSVYKKGFWIGAKTTKSPAPAGETRNRKSIVINRNILGQDYEVITFLHELFHTAKDNSHKDIAVAISEIEGFSRQFKDHIKNLKGEDQQETERSNLINTWIQRYCTDGFPGQWERNLKKIGVN